MTHTVTGGDDTVTTPPSALTEGAALHDASQGWA
jgi:hypothetical protein